MKSMWISDWLTRSPGLVADQEREALAERDVAGGVLVEQRVVEDGVERADAALAVDERDLAEAGRALVARADRAHRLGRGVGVDLDRAAALEAHAAGRARRSRPSARAASSR